MSTLATIDKVAEFHRAFHQPIADTPDVPRPAFTERAELRHAALRLRQVRATLRQHGRSVAALRVALIVEELSELTDALANGDAVEALDALVDLRYVTDGAVLTYGFHTPTHPDGLGRFDTAFHRVHTSNMSKLGPDGQALKDPCGKIIKGPNYQPPQLADLVRP